MGQSPASCRADGIPCRRALVSNTEITSSAKSVSVAMPQCPRVARAKSRPILTDSERGLSAQVADGWAAAGPSIVADTGARGGLKALIPAGPLGARSQSWLTLMTSVVTGEAARCAVLGVPSVLARTCRTSGAQALSSPVYLASARPDARADESSSRTCEP